MVFAADIGGDELMQLYLTASTGPDPVPLFPNDPKESRADFVQWSDDGDSFLYTSSRRDLHHMDLYRYDLASKTSTLLFQGTDKLQFALASRDQTTIILNEEVSDADTNLYMLRNRGSQPELLTPHKGAVTYSAMDLSPDGRSLYYTSDDSGEFAALRTMDLTSRTSKLKFSPPWDVFIARFSRGKRYFFTSFDEDGTARTKISRTSNGQTIGWPSTLPESSVLPISSSVSDRWVAVRLESDTSPRSIWLIDLQKATARRLLSPLPPSLQGHQFTESTLVRVVSFDGLKIPAFVYRPKGEGPFPAVLDIHGGPTEQAPRTFRPFAQYLVSKGYVVMVPNVRGSAGYGKRFAQLDNKDFGGGPLKDVLACKAWLIANSNVDSSRVGIMGQSYGGYMSLAAATFAPTAFSAMVDFFGPSDLTSLVESFPSYWASSSAYIYQKFGDPKNPADRQYQHDRSPLNFTDRIVRPVLVVQGSNDARVKQDQSDRLVAALRKRKITVEYLVIEGEGHGFSSTQNQVRALEAADRFFDRYLGERGSATQ